jgi:heat-inducible transcriptional repressor
MTKRQEKLLAAILREYVREAEPVSSGFLAKETSLAVSPATIRNELAELETDGYLLQPHTSAGRAPTEKAWRWYVQHLLKEREVEQSVRERMVDVMRVYRHTHSELLRHMARKLAEVAGETVLVGYGPHETYYTGLSNLFGQPEFSQLDMVQSMSRVVDRFDEVMQRLFDRMEQDVEVLVGKDNPFSPDCGAVVARYRLSDEHGLIGILGPMRQDYNEHIALLKFTTDHLNKITDYKNHD